MTTQRYCSSKPIWSSSTKYNSTASLRFYSHMSPPFTNRRKTKKNNYCPNNNHCTRGRIYFFTSHRISWSLIYNVRWRLWVHLLPSNRVPWTSCNNWNNILDRLPNTTKPISLYNHTPLRLRSRRMILTFCRHSMNFPLYLNLLMRVISL